MLPSSKYLRNSIIESVVELLLEFDSATFLSNDDLRLLSSLADGVSVAGESSFGAEDWSDYCGTVGILTNSLVIRLIVLSRLD